jgi:shikimate dehydrogenase
VSERFLAVLGHPVEHSLSPALHTAAYAELGLDWAYGRLDVREHELAGFLEGLDSSWRGLSATMPLKDELARLGDDADRTVELTGAANTLLFAEDGRRVLRNTDVAGVEAALHDAGLRKAEHAVIVGAGATARSVIVALDAFGVRGFTMVVRDPTRAIALRELADRLGLECDAVAFDDLPAVVAETDVVAWTLPNGVPLEHELPHEARERAIALDVTYHPWPGPLAAQWLASGGRVASGRDMLLHQAVRQVRFFVSGQTEVPLEREAAVEAVMASALA